MKWLFSVEDGEETGGRTVAIGGGERDGTGGVPAGCWPLIPLHSCADLLFCCYILTTVLWWEEVLKRPVLYYDSFCYDVEVLGGWHVTGDSYWLTVLWRALHYLWWYTYYWRGVFYLHVLEFVVSLLCYFISFIYRSIRRWYRCIVNYTESGMTLHRCIVLMLMIPEEEIAIVVEYMFCIYLLILLFLYPYLLL